MARRGLPVHEYVAANTYLDRTRAEPRDDGTEQGVPAYEYPAPADD